jgi:hypothetical protein
MLLLNKKIPSIAGAIFPVKRTLGLGGSISITALALFSSE